MASASSILEDIDDKFCQCCLCFEQYKDPRQLPCLHRYCAECLQKLIIKTGGDIKCPLCQEPVDVPENGAQGLRKDFYMNEIIDYVQVKKSLKDNKQHTCGDCSKTVKASAYCFRCSDFLCNDCHEYHLTRKSLKEHKPHILALNDVESKNITLEKLSSLREAPRCGPHPDKVADLCCKSCSNLPICVSCTYGKHKGHQIEEVIALAETEKRRLEQKVAPLDECKVHLYETSKRVDLFERELCDDTSTHKTNLQKTYKAKVTDLDVKLSSISEELSKCKDDITKEREERASARAKEMEQKMEEIINEYAKLNEMDENEFATKLSTTTEKIEKEERDVITAKNSLKTKFEETSDKLEKEQAEKMKRRKEISDYLHHTIQRYENLTATTSNILVSKNSWTVVQNVDNICLATEPLLQDMKREFTQLDMIPKYSNVNMGRFWGKRNVRLPQHIERVVDIEGIRDNQWYLNGITCTGNGDVVISGGAGGCQSFITVITMRGKPVKRQLIEPHQGGRVVPHANPPCYCAPFNEFKVATACYSDEVGLFDIRDRSYCKKNLCDVIPGWPSGREVRCITTDEVNNHVIVGCNTTDVYVLDDQLNHHSTIRLSEMIRLPQNITVSDGHLIVCDRDGKRACAVNMKGELQYEFTKPGIEGCDTPFSVCTDRSGFIYILWVDRVWVPCDQNCVVAQYSQDDHRLLSKTSMYTSAVCITIAETDQTEKLLVATYKSGKLHVYDLVDTDGSCKCVTNSDESGQYKRLVHEYVLSDIVKRNGHF